MIEMNTTSIYMIGINYKIEKIFKSNAIIGYGCTDSQKYISQVAFLE